MRKRFVIVGAVLALLGLACGEPGSAGDDPAVMARVNGTAITRADLDRAMAEAGGLGSAASHAETRRKVVQDLIDAEVVYQEYRRRYGADLPKAKVVRRFLDEEIAAAITVDDAEIDAWWDGNVRGTPGEAFGLDRTSVERRLKAEKTRDLYARRIAELRARARIEVR